MMKTVKGWWFAESKTLPHGDGRKIAIGQTHKVKGPIVPCTNGLHLSRKPLDALRYAPGPIVYRVQGGGTIVELYDKCACSERTYLGGGIDVSDVLRLFARKCALDVVHLWDCPSIVMIYLKTGDESIRNAAMDAAKAAVRGSAWVAARTAAWAAEAEAAARDAAWAAEAEAAARDAAWAAARDAAWATGDAAATWEKQNRRLTAMLSRAIKGSR